MSAIDLREIEPPHVASGDQDRFELFARDFLEALGFRIIQGPGRGADRGRDLIVGEALGGPITAVERRWLVSAKHKAHSGKSVTDADEPDPVGRVRRFKVDGFMAFYSTLPSSGLDDTFARLVTETPIHVWDSGRIQQVLAGDHRLASVWETYLPESFARLRKQAPADIFAQPVDLFCGRCGADLRGKDGIVAFVMERTAEDADEVVDLYWCCRGECDRILRDRLPKGRFTAWEDLNDLRIPLVYLRYVLATLNNMRSGRDRYSDAAFGKEKELLLALAPDVMRDSTPRQKERISHLTTIPAWLGGLGYDA